MDCKEFVWRYRRKMCIQNLSLLFFLKYKRVFTIQIVAKEHDLKKKKKRVEKRDYEKW